MRIIVALALVLVGCEGSGPALIDAPKFTCGSATCETATQFCYQIESGRLPASPAGGCNAIPAACGNAPSCECVTGAFTFSCGGTSCSALGSAITVTCANP
ncbi:MAG TPA: hypothetical protein VGL61_04310 [Kofleriaceae bacterium]|jgi:hypothetical protein